MQVVHAVLQHDGHMQHKLWERDDRKEWSVQAARERHKQQQQHFTRTAHTKRQAHGMQGEYSATRAYPKPRGASPMHLVASCRRSRESEERRALVLFMMCSCACLARVEIKLASAAVVRAGIPAKKQAWSVTGSVPSANRWHGARMARAFPLGRSRAQARTANKGGVTRRAATVARFPPPMREGEEGSPEAISGFMIRSFVV